VAVFRLSTGFMARQQESLFDTRPELWELDAADDWQAARVVFSRSPFGPYDYLVPTEMRGKVEAGQRLRVPLGRSGRLVIGFCTAIVTPGHADAASVNAGRLKPVESIVDLKPLLSAGLLQLGQWISDRWHCPPGTTYDSIVPAAVRELSNTRETIFLESDPEVVARLDEMRLTPHQRAALEFLRDSPESLTPAELAKAAGCTTAPIMALRKKNLLRTSRVRMEQKAFPLAGTAGEADYQLNDDQQQALTIIHHSLEQCRHETILLHGITGSGKTEVYIQAIRKVIEFGRTAIVLVPEISLTPQTRRRFCERFDKVAVLHSNLTPAQRAWHWRQIAAGNIQVVIGARSAVFAPVPHLGLIILDEEHDGSFKQDTAPRYHARDVARQRSLQQNVPLILGSATPSLETWKLAMENKATTVSLPRRIMNLPLPDVVAVDMRGEFVRRHTRGSISRPLHAAMLDSLRSGGQVILLLNRRGYSTMVQCPQCGTVVHCPDCAIAMTHHKDRKFLMCHYCDHRKPVPDACAECGFNDIFFSGTGTQRLEQEVLARFPAFPCERMDTDSMQRPGSHELALDRFRAGETKILLGTQMIAKGLDFPNVTVVGVVNADTALHLNDFRAGERTFTLITQVAGRTGRGPRGGRVLVQTYNPDHPAIVAAMRHDYETFATGELASRSEFGYPPYQSLARFVIRSEKQRLASDTATRMAEIAAAWPGKDESMVIVGPAEAPINKLRGKFRYHFLLQGPDEEPLHAWIRHIESQVPELEEVQHIVDFDPLEMM
jgi:primosomal protein N' (replication factor Y) (superfamily II helicase)